MNGEEIDMRMFAQRTGANVTYPAGSIVFNEHAPLSCVYLVHSRDLDNKIGEGVLDFALPKKWYES